MISRTGLCIKHRRLSHLTPFVYKITSKQILRRQTFVHVYNQTISVTAPVVSGFPRPFGVNTFRCIRQDRSMVWTFRIIFVMEQRQHTCSNCEHLQPDYGYCSIKEHNQQALGRPLALQFDLVSVSAASTVSKETRSRQLKRRPFVATETPVVTVFTPKIEKRTKQERQPSTTA